MINTKSPGSRVKQVPEPGVGGWGGGGEGTRLPYSLGGGVPLGSRKSYHLLDREEILQIFVILLQFMSA